jgi:WD40 repeat protein
LHEQIEVLLKEDRRQRAVLLVDQFEEIFSPNQDEAARIAFINLLAAAQHPQSRLNIILTLRSDFIPACADYPQLNELINRQFYQIGAMTPRESGTAIVLPALEVGVKIDPELVAHVTADMKGEPGALPLMSFVLRDLFQAAPKKKGEPLTLGVSDYLQRGGLEHALQRHADEVFAQFSAPQQALARHIFSRLVDVDERIDTRCTVTLNELVPMGETIEAAAAVIRALSGDKARLLTTDRVDSDEMGTPTSTTITLAHEKLIDAWPWLRQLVDENRKLIALQNQIANDAQVWAREQDAGYLYRSGRLAQVEEKLAELQPNLNDLSQQFVEASRSEQKRQQAAEEQQRRNEAELYIQREVKKRIQASQLAFAAKAELARDPERALLLAIAGLGINIQPNTYLALADSLQSHYRTTLYGHEAGIGSAVFSPDGQTILTAGCDEQGTGDHCTSTARLWDRQGNQLAVLRGHENVIWSIAFSPDGQTILTASEDGTVRLWDRQGNELAVVLRGLGDGANSTVLSPYGANSAVFSPDGQAILTTAGFGFSDAEEFDWTDYMAQLWDLQGNELAVLRGGKYVVSSAKFSPDGQTILTIGLGLDKFEGFNYINDTVRLWSLQGKELTVLSGHEDTITSAVFSPDGQTILTTSNDDTARLWDREGNDLAILQHEGGVNSAVFSPDGQMILTAGSADSTARLWDLQGNLLSALREHLRDVNSAIFSPDGQIILTASEDNTARLWDLQGNVLTILT